MTATQSMDEQENTNQNANTTDSSETETGEELGERCSTSGSGTSTICDNMTIVFKCIMKDDVERFTQCFEDEEDPYKDTIGELICKRNDEGKSPLDMAAILGRNAMLKELLTRGVEVNVISGKGYTALHHAAAWGRVDCLKVLVEGGGDLQLKTTHGETARDVALRYHQAECVDYLDWAEAKQQMSDYITNMQETMADTEKTQGRIDRAEKNSTLALIKEKLEWLEAATEATTQDFISQKQQMEETLQPIIQKLSEPPTEKSEKK